MRTHKNCQLYRNDIRDQKVDVIIDTDRFSIGNACYPISEMVVTPDNHLVIHGSAYVDLSSSSNVIG